MSALWPTNTLAAPQASQLKEGHPRLVEQFALGRRPAQRPPWGFGLSRFGIQMGQGLLDDLRIFDKGDDSQHYATGRAGLSVDTKHRFQVLG